MKYFVIFLLSLFCNQLDILGQSKSYGFVTIGSWTLEKFPKHYLIKAKKINTERNPFTKKLELWEELDEYGRNRGLKIEFQSNGVLPATADYYYNGECVYSAEFFNNSKKASYIRNKNKDGIVDGPQVERFDDYKGGITESISFYEDGTDVKRDEKPYGFSNDVNWVNGLLDGKFFFATPNFSRIEGIASKGSITYFREQTFDDIISEFEFIKNSIVYKVTKPFKDEVTGAIKDSTNSYQISSKRKSLITNDKKLKGRQPYFYCGTSLDKIVIEFKSYFDWE